MRKDVLLAEPVQTEPGLSDPLDLSVAATPTSRHKGLAANAVTGFGWLFAQNIGARVIGFLSQILLARIFAPADFATLALAGTVTAIVSVLANFGVDDALLQRQRSMRFWTMPAFITSLGLGVLSTGLVIAAAPLAARLYHAPILFPMLSIMALGMSLGALSTVPEVKIRSTLNFRFLAGYATVELVLSQLSIIALALLGFGVFSFVLPAPILAVMKAVVFWSVAKPKLGKLRPRQLGMIGSTGATIFGTKVITAIVGQGDYFTLGLFAAKPVVGAYYFAFRLAIQPVQMLAGNLSSVLFPALAQLRGDPHRQKEAALNASRVLAAVIMPYCFLQAAVARPVISLVFGTKWDAAIPIVQILSIGLAFDAVSWVAGALLSARGEFKRAFLYSCAFSPPFFVVVALGAKLDSAIGVATAVSLFYMVLAPCFTYAAFRSIGISLREVAGIYVGPSLIAAVAMGAAVLIAGLAAPLVRIPQAGLTVLVGGGLYVGLARVLTPAIFHQLSDRFTSMLRNRTRPAAA
jgi:O-antigen/teichoic acid export membrane protein